MYVFRYKDLRCVLFGMYLMLAIVDVGYNHDTIVF